MAAQFGYCQRPRCGSALVMADQPFCNSCGSAIPRAAQPKPLATLETVPSAQPAATTARPMSQPGSPRRMAPEAPRIPRARRSWESCLESEMRGRGKNLTTAYLLWFFLGFLFVHRFYLKRSGGVFLMATLISLVLCLVLIGFIFLIILSIMWLADAFRMSGFVQAYNGALEGQIITEILAARAGGMRMPYGGGYGQRASYAPAYAPPMGPPAWTPTHRVPSPVEWPRGMLPMGRDRQSVNCPATLNSW